MDCLKCYFSPEFTAAFDGCYSILAVTAEMNTDGSIDKFPWVGGCIDIYL